MSIQKNINASLIYQIGITVLTFLSLLLITRILDVNSRGELAIYTNAMALGTTIFSFSLGSALVYFIAAKKVDLAIIIQQISIVIGASILMLLAVVTVLHFAGYQSVITPFTNQYSYLVLFVLHIIFNILQIYLIALFNAENNFIQPLKLQFGFLLLQNIALVCIYNHWCPASFYNSSSPIILLLILILLLQVIGLSVYFFKAKQFKFAIKLSEIYWPIFAYSALAFACNAVQMLCYRIDIWFLQAYHTNSIVAVYAIAVACLQMFWILSNQIVSVLFTTFAKQQHALAPTTIAQIHNILFWLSLITFGIALVFGYYLIPLFFGVAYSQSASLLGVLLIGGIPFSSTLVITAYNASSNKMRINLIGSILGLVVCLLLNFLLIPKYSYYGAAVASAISYLATSIYFWVQFCLANSINIATFIVPSVTLFKNTKQIWQQLQQPNL